MRVSKSQRACLFLSVTEPAALAVQSERLLWPAAIFAFLEGGGDRWHCALHMESSAVEVSFKLQGVLTGDLGCSAGVAPPSARVAPPIFSLLYVPQAVGELDSRQVSASRLEQLLIRLLWGSLGRLHFFPPLFASPAPFSLWLGSGFWGPGEPFWGM